ncbi:MAG: hypothetical protein J6U63_06625, partial [Clostridia bacterium]|nr:hypothetical protein [Clostridia bacterium]
KLSDFGLCETPGGILAAGDYALEEGMDGRWVLQKMGEEAAAQDMLEVFQYLCENVSARDNEEYQKIEAALAGMEDSHEVDLDNYSAGDDYQEFGSLYETPYVSDAMAELLKDSGAHYCFEPAFWTEKEFKEVFGTSYSSFVPKRPRPGFACVIIKNGAQYFPGREWKDGVDDYDFEFALDRNIFYTNLTLYEDGEAPVFTANPHLASEFWVYNVRYTYYADYGEQGDTRFVKGYDVEMSLTVEKADGKGDIAVLTMSDRLPDRISSWSDWTAFPDTPIVDRGTSKMNDFVKKIRTNLVKERAAGISGQAITYLNADKVINSILVEQAESVSDPWQKAIYESGAKNVSVDDDVLTFYMRGFDPGLSEMPAYAEEKDGWLEQALDNMQQYNLELSLPLKSGQLPTKSMDTLKSTVKTAASNAQKALKGADLSAAIKETMFFPPLPESVTDATKILNPDEGFIDWAYRNSDLSPYALAPLFYTEKSQSMSLSGGPHAITLECTGGNAPEMIKAARLGALDAFAYVTADERDALDAEEQFQLALAKNALEARKSSKNKFTITLDLDTFRSYNLPEEYEAFINSYPYEDALDSLTEIIYQLPDIAAEPLPKNGKMKGGSNGTQVIVKISENSNATYVQLRNDDTGEIVATAFIRPGKQVTMYAAKGMYRIL